MNRGGERGRKRVHERIESAAARTTGDWAREGWRRWWQLQRTNDGASLWCRAGPGRAEKGRAAERPRPRHRYAAMKRRLQQQQPHGDDVGRGSVGGRLRRLHDGGDLRQLAAAVSGRGVRMRRRGSGRLDRVRGAAAGARRMAGGPLVVVEGRPRDAAPYPRMAQRLGRLDARLRVPLQAAADEVDEERVVAALERLLEVARAGRAAQLAAARGAAAQRDGAVGHGDRLAVPRQPFRADEVLRALPGAHHVLRRHAQQLDDAGELVALVLARQQRQPGEQLAQDAAQAPHVDGRVVRQPQDHLRGPVEARLDVRVQALVLVAARAEIDYLQQKIQKIIAPLAQTRIRV